MSDLSGVLGFLSGLERLCEHPSHNEPAGCGNPDCWKYQQDAFTSLSETLAEGMTREQWEQYTLNDYYNKE